MTTGTSRISAAAMLNATLWVPVPSSFVRAHITGHLRLRPGTYPPAPVKLNIQPVPGRGSQPKFGVIIFLRVRKIDPIKDAWIERPPASAGVISVTTLADHFRFGLRIYAHAGSLTSNELRLCKRLMAHDFAIARMPHRKGLCVACDPSVRWRFLRAGIICCFIIV